MRLFSVGCLFVIVHAASAQLPTAKPVPRVQVLPLPHHITSFQLEGRELTACHYEPQDMRPFWYPIRASKEISLTRMGHPHDPWGHSHHNSVWISHNSVNGLDFWGDHAKQQGRIVTVQVPRDAYEDGDEFASMRMINHWIKVEDQSAQLIETRRAEVRPLDGAKSWMMILDLEFTTPKGQKAEFGATGFGLVAVRVAKNIGVHDGGGRLLNSEGQINEKAMFRLPARWVDYSGRITPEDDGFAGITLMNHPMNPENPTAFHVRDDGWMGACLSLEKPIEITEAKKLRVRYALWVHDGVPTQKQSEVQWKAFVDLPVVDLNAQASGK
ncbi:Methane oxygenase PmoA [Prosthecobacter debontii]|uniref:Methane oxygenase PmoA n=1 Tax=Prosthecobacter debontii TaxID=48467 RepID=A0A1T4YDN6_9BACT|nr:PmoA family protein [Prosthecobacter debontii]SKA99658.1 Methane oxygenase PmoA [Prosthecobacter debontii]